jgi:hypothetical protein
MFFKGHWARTRCHVLAREAVAGLTSREVRQNSKKHLGADGGDILEQCFKSGEAVDCVTCVQGSKQKLRARLRMWELRADDVNCL